MVARKPQRNRLALDIGVPSGRITDILNGPAARSSRIPRYGSADTSANSAQFWLDLQGQYEHRPWSEREKGAEIARRVRPGGLRHE